MRVVYVVCDVCAERKAQSEIKMNYKLDVIFTTDTTEGRSCNPYLSNVEMDLCNDCRGKIVKSKRYLLASGGQGSYEYEIQQGDKNNA